jgi:hypothetical protein
MNKGCLEIGIIQAFLDGELAGQEVTRVSTHIAACEACAIMLSQAEDESAIVFPALAREFDTLVPTQRLWNRINESIAIEKRQTSIWQKAYTFFAASFASPSITAAAGLLIVAGVFATLMINRSSEPSDVANVNATLKSTTPTLLATISPRNDNPVTSSWPAFRPKRAVYASDARRHNSQNAYYKTQPATIMTADLMPGEDSYVKTIANLTKTVEDQKAGGILSPSQRVSYERDMAVVDDAIAKMRAALKRNPKNESAKQVLYSSYQNKIDLLNSVAQKEELVASLN